MSGLDIGSEYVILDSDEATNTLHILNASTDIAVNDLILYNLQ